MLRLKIVSPESVVFEGEVNSVLVPGTMDSFQILNDHAPIISSLQPGRVEYEAADGRHEMMIGGGFVEVQKNVVSLCVEIQEA